jgi:hypothetical protein
MGFSSTSFDPALIATNSDAASSAMVEANAASAAAATAAAKASDASSAVAARSAIWDKASAASSAAVVAQSKASASSAAATKDNYASWSFAVDGVTKDAIISGDVLDFVGGDDITITRSADDKITIGGDGVLKQNLITNSSFGVWSNGTVADYSDSNLMGEYTGSQLAPTACCTDPDNDQDVTTGWTATNATLSSIAGGVTGNKLKVVAGVGSGRAYKGSLSLTSGKFYRFKARAGADVADNYRIYFSSSTYGVNACDTGIDAGVGAGSWDTHNFVWKCPSTQTDWRINLEAAGDSDNAYFDNVTLQEVTDAFYNMAPIGCCTDSSLPNATVTTGWTASNATLTSEAGGVTGNRLKVAATAANGRVDKVSISLTAGKLYRLKIKAGADIGDEYKITLGSSTYGAYIYNSGAIAGAGAGTWDTIDVIIECLSTQSDWVLRLYAVNNTDNAYFDNVSLSEMTPACVAADTKAPDGWMKTSTNDIYREHTGSNTKDGSFYASKSVPTAQWNALTWPILGIRNSEVYYKKFAGRTITLGCWVKSSTADDAYIQIKDSDSNSSTSRHTGGGTYEWLEITRTVGSSITWLEISLLHGNASPGIAYISQPMLVFGNSIGEGNYMQPPGEIIWCEVVVGTADYAWAGTISSDTTINVEEQTSGKIPKGSQALFVTTMGVCANTGNKYYSVVQDSGHYGNYVYSIVANSETTFQGFVFCDTNGDFCIKRNDTWTSFYLAFQAVQIR